MLSLEETQQQLPIHLLPGLTLYATNSNDNFLESNEPLRCKLRETNATTAMCICICIVHCAIKYTAHAPVADLQEEEEAIVPLAVNFQQFPNFDRPS